MTKGSDYHNDFDVQSNLAGLGETLGRNVKRLRLEQKLDKKTFSLMVGIGRPLLDKIEKGQSDIRLSYLQRLADALAVAPIDLLVPESENAGGAHPDFDSGARLR